MHARRLHAVAHAKLLTDQEKSDMFLTAADDPCQFLLQKLAPHRKVAGSPVALAQIDVSLVCLSFHHMSSGFGVERASALEL